MPQKILVIDDEILILKTIEKTLSMVGYSVYCIRFPSELDKILSSGPFDLLLTDVNMEDLPPENVIEILRRTSPDIKILYMSGSTNEKDYDNFIEKPFRIEDLKKKIRDLLDETSRY